MSTDSKHGQDGRYFVLNRLWERRESREGGTEGERRGGEREKGERKEREIKRGRESKGGRE